MEIAKAEEEAAEAAWLAALEEEQAWLAQQEAAAAAAAVAAAAAGVPHLANGHVSTEPLLNWACGRPASGLYDACLMPSVMVVRMLDFCP